MTPWLPPDVGCGTGTILSNDTVARSHTQDDIILYDRQLVPSVLASAGAPEGMFLLNGVLARIEVKSTLDAAGLDRFVQSSKEIAGLRFAVREGFKGNMYGPFNGLFAFASDATTAADCELHRLWDTMKKSDLDSLSGIVSGICIPGKGFWKIGLDSQGQRCWQRHLSKSAEDHLAWFVGFLSNSCYDQRMIRQGLNPQNALNLGIGGYLDHPFEPVV